MELNIGASRTAGSERSRRHAAKILLLFVELLAVAGLLLMAGHLWQVRQALHEDLSVAREVEAAIQSAGAIAGVGERAVGERESALDAGSRSYASGARWQSSPMSREVQRLPALWLLAGANDER